MAETIYDERKILEQIAQTAQVCIQKHPALILGSGASVIHGIRGMKELADYLKENLTATTDEETSVWLSIRSALDDGGGLEEVLLGHAAPSSLVRKIVRLTWKAIASDDSAIMGRVACREEKFPLSTLIDGMFKSTHKVINIVTPNYDRIAEFAADAAGYLHATGFLPGIIRTREGGEKISIYRGAHAIRTVRIWKVHGSLDWFASEDGRVLSLPISTDPPEKFDPLIVTPGISKYERTHDEPFRSAIQGADAAMETAASFLCVGYGFRDRHIQPKIVERCSQANVPIVILARTLTDEAKEFLAKSAGQEYLALEKSDAGTRVYSPEFKDGLAIAQPELWSFEKFNSLVL